MSDGPEAVSRFRGTTREGWVKVPEITVVFWVAKIVSTAFGEALSDLLNQRFDPYVVVPLAGVLCLAALLVQLFADRYQPLRYWFAVAMVAIFGTMVADVIHVQLGVPYAVSTVGFAVVLALVLAAWHASEKTLSIHSIRTRRRETFYWATVVVTFALGTAVGDLTAVSFDLGYLASGVVFAVLMLVPLVGYSKLLPRRMNVVVAFWFAYILTRPLGASFADYFSKSKAGGLGYGDGIVSVVLLVMMLLAVASMLVGRDGRRAQPDASSTARIRESDIMAP